MSQTNLKDAISRLNGMQPALDNEKSQEHAADQDGQHKTQETDDQGESAKTTNTKRKNTKGKHERTVIKVSMTETKKDQQHKSDNRDHFHIPKIPKPEIAVKQPIVKDTNPKTKEVNPEVTETEIMREELSNNQTTRPKTETELSLGRMERQFCDYFGATPSLPKIKKVIRKTAKEVEKQHTMTEEERAEKLKEVYARLEEIEKLKAESQAIVDSFAKSKTMVEPKSPNISRMGISEGGLTFDFTKTPDSDSFSLPAYFHKNMQTLQGNLPLTIFNREWQQAASDNHVDYRKADKEIDKYRGHPYPGEWTQSRFEWGGNFDTFITTCRDTYNYISFADALETRKRNVITIFKQQRSWVVAFRYDLTIRKATFAIRNPGEAIPNPALEPPGLLNEIYYAARSQDDLNTEDNPYKKGGPKFGRNPYSDIVSDSTSTSNHIQTSTRAGPSRYGNEKPYNKNQTTYGNYKGKRFNPNYKRPEGNGNEMREKGKEKKV